jgi:hypothetical protein
LGKEAALGGKLVGQDRADRVDLLVRLEVEVQGGRHGGGVFGKLLALRKAEGDRLEPVVVEQGAAQDALVRWLDFLRRIKKMCVVLQRVLLLPQINPPYRQALSGTRAS